MKRPLSTSSRRVTILHVITTLRTGGAETMLARLLSRMDRTGIDSVVVALREGGSLAQELRGNGITVHFADLSSVPRAPARLVSLLGLVREVRPNLIQGWMYHGNLVAEMARALSGLATHSVWNIRHSLHNLRCTRRTTVSLIRVLARFSSRPACIVYNSHTSARQHEAIGYSRERTAVVPNGFDCDLFRPDAAARLAVRRELGVSDGALLVGLVARYHPVKDHANFFAAAARLSRILPDAHFVLAGDQLSTDNGELMSQISRAGIADRVHTLGERTDTHRLNAAMDVATCCSLAESFPNVVGEAMACGVPCVVTDVGDSARIVGNSGLVVPAGDAEALCGAWASLLSAGAAVRRGLGDTARQRIVDLYSLGSVVAAYEELYGRLLGCPFTESRPRRAAD